MTNKLQIAQLNCEGHWNEMRVAKLNMEIKLADAADAQRLRLIEFDLNLCRLC